MLDEIIIGQIVEREIGKEKKERKDTGWQPVPLYKELDLPQYIPEKKEKKPSGPIEIDIWGPEMDDNVIQTCSYNTTHYFQ